MTGCGGKRKRRKVRHQEFIFGLVPVSLPLQSFAEELRNSLCHGDMIDRLANC